MNVTIQHIKGTKSLSLPRPARRSRRCGLHLPTGVWILGFAMLVAYLPGHASERWAAEAGVPPFVLSGEPEGARSEVYDIVSLRLADLVIVSAGYNGGYRPGMLCVVHRDSEPVAEVLLVEVRERVSAAIIRDMIPGQVIQPGDAVQIKTVHF